MTKWLGPVPTNCDVCKALIQTEFFDARTRSGRWGTLCLACWKQENGKFGIGHAQHYKNTAEGWVKQ